MERVELRSLVLATGCAEERAGYVFLRDPHWKAAELAQVEELLQRSPTRPRDLVEDGWLCVPTGGTSGGVRFARHDERTLTAAVRGFCAHFGVKRVNAIDVLPAHHVSGLMARVRCAETGGSYLSWSWKQLEAGEWPRELNRDGWWCLSLVPTQLQRLLEQPGAVERLRECRMIFVGGGPVWPELTRAAAAAQVPVVLSYGMTETAAMIAAQRPGEFAEGDRTAGAVMPHARVRIVDENTGAPIEVGETGLVRIEGQSLFRGYWPETRLERSMTTEDLGMIDAEGRLTVIGRRDAMIITGGKKVQPAEVEDALRASGFFDDVAVVGVSHPEWGEAVAACYPRSSRFMEAAQVAEALNGLAAYKRPKYFVPLETWPRNAQGKLNRAALKAAAVSALVDPR